MVGKGSVIGPFFLGGTVVGGFCDLGCGTAPRNTVGLSLTPSQWVY